jgi:hypothetical protein
MQLASPREVQIYDPLVLPCGCFAPNLLYHAGRPESQKRNLLLAASLAGSGDLRAPEFCRVATDCRHRGKHRLELFRCSR